MICHFPVTKSSCVHLCWKHYPVAQTVGLCKVLLPWGWGWAERLPGRLAGFLPLTLPLLLLKVPSMEVIGDFSN